MRRSRSFASLSIGLAALFLPSPCPAQADTVEDYAAACYAALGITKDDMESAFGGTNRACRYGVKLTTRHNNVALDPLNPAPGLNLAPGTKNFLTKCDAPAWLPSGTPTQCYNSTYITALSPLNHSNVKAALLCRHKSRDPELDPVSKTPTDEDFDDVALIVHDQKSGKTCWFQTPDGASIRRDGNHVPVPHLVSPPPGVPAASAFWMKPSVTGQINCAQCHDNGPWMNSQWLYSQFKELTDEGPGKYETVAYTGFNSWPKTDDYVEVGRAGLEGTDPGLTPAQKEIQRRLPECTSCHKLAAARFNGVDWPGGGGLLGDTANGTYVRWFPYSTGREPITDSTATEHSPRLPEDYPFTHWMPPGTRRPADAATYDKVYLKHLEILKTCMQTLRADRKAPCATTKLAIANPAPSGSGALVSAVNVQTGQTYSATAVPLDSSEPPTPQILAEGQSLRLGWQADATFPVCTIRATMPAGVLVSAANAAGSETIGSGANWQLAESPPVIGPLTEPGVYNFSITCRDTYTASLQFQIGTTGPRSVVQLATSVNHKVVATAVHSNGPRTPSTVVDAQATDRVELSWIADNVRAGSCILSGPGANSIEEVGSRLAAATPADQTFTFQCTGENDAALRSVSATIHRVSPNCAYSIAPASAAAPAAGSAGTITVTAGPGCAWAVGAKPDWVTITSGATGIGNGAVAYSVQPNPGSARTGTVTVAGQTFTLSQAAQAAQLVATLSVPSVPVSEAGSITPLGDIRLAISGGAAGQRVTANVAVFLNTPVAAVADTALLADATGATIAAVKSANSYTFPNVQFEQPGAGTAVYSIRNMKANTSSLAISPSGSAQVIALVTMTGAVPIQVGNPAQTVALISQRPTPLADSVIPASGTGAAQVFRLSYSHPNGYLNLSTVSVVFRSNDHQKKECRVDYDRARNALYLASDAGPVRGPIVPGSAGSLRNSRCELNGVGSSVAVAGNTLTLNLNLAFGNSFSGSATILMEASDGTQTSGLQVRGAWVVP